MFNFHPCDNDSAFWFLFYCCPFFGAILSTNDLSHLCLIKMGFNAVTAPFYFSSVFVVVVVLCLGNLSPTIIESLHILLILLILHLKLMTHFETLSIRKYGKLQVKFCFLTVSKLHYSNYWIFLNCNSRNDHFWCGKLLQIVHHFIVF